MHSFIYVGEEKFPTVFPICIGENLLQGWTIIGPYRDLEVPRLEKGP